MAEVKHIQLTGIDNAELLHVIGKAKEALPDCTLATAHRTKATYVPMKVGKGKGAKIVKVANGPWSSRGMGNLLDHYGESEALAALAKDVTDKLPPGRWELFAWANEFKRGDFQDEHDHAFDKIDGQRVDNKYAAIYYVQAEGGCKLALATGETLEVKTGDLIIIPAWLKHSVPYYDGVKDRYSIAFNIRSVG